MGFGDTLSVVPGNGLVWKDQSEHTCSSDEIAQREAERAFNQASTRS